LNQRDFSRWRLSFYMELTRFDLRAQATQERIAAALERIASVLEQRREPGADEAALVTRIAALEAEVGWLAEKGNPR
jgi:hypothetical protein